MDLLNDEQEVLDDEREPLNYRVLASVLLVCLGLLFSRVTYLQVVKGAEYRALAEGNKLRVQYLLAPRGLLLDRSGEVIASNTPSFELVAVTADLPKDKVEFDGRLTQVAGILDMDPTKLLENLKKMNENSYQAQTLVENITKDQALIFISKAQELKGFAVQNNAIRDYKDPLAFAHLTGYTGKITQDELNDHKDASYILNDYMGKTGIEYEYENYLRGINGRLQAEVDATGSFKKTLAEIPAQPGSNIKLNIDYDLQKKIYESLNGVMEARRLKRAAAVSTNPKTGEVLALVSLPAFDSNMFARGISQDEYSKLINDTNNPLLNRVVTGQYPPGSTIKPVMATAALSEGVVSAQTKILDDGVIRVGKFTFYGYEREGLGLMDIYSAIAKSSDIYFYSIGGGNAKSAVKDGLGPVKIADWFRKFHLGTALGIDLPSEKKGLVPDPDWKEKVKKEQWYLGDTYHESIGQGDVLATPLQINSWTATIANGGKIMRPYILNEVTDKDGKILTKGQPKVLAENIFNLNVIKIVQDGMRQTVTDGSGLSLASLPIEISGKTGTAQFDAADLNKTHAMFTSYAPSDSPQIAFTVLVEAGGEGHAVAVPIAKQVYEWWAQNRYKK